MNTNEDASLIGTEGLPSGAVIYTPFNAASETTRGIDGKSTRANKLNLKPGDVPKGPLVACNDNGPTSDYMARKIAVDVPAQRRNATRRAANDNKKERLHIKELFERGELGNGPPENQYHWFLFNRLRRDLRIASGEPINDSVQCEWRDLMPAYFSEGIFGNRLTSIETDQGLIFTDDGEFSDTDTPADFHVVDGAKEELEPIEAHIRATQVIARARDELGNDFELLSDVNESNLTARRIGESTGLRDRATASARGKLLLHTALRNLGRFYDRLDRLENSDDGKPRPRALASGNSFWNQTRGPVIRLYGPNEKCPFYGAYSTKPTPRCAGELL